VKDYTVDVGTSVCNRCKNKPICAIKNNIGVAIKIRIMDCHWMVEIDDE